MQYLELFVSEEYPKEWNRFFGTRFVNDILPLRKKYDRLPDPIQLIPILLQFYKKEITNTQFKDKLKKLYD